MNSGQMIHLIILIRIIILISTVSVSHYISARNVHLFHMNYNKRNI